MLSKSRNKYEHLETRKKHFFLKGSRLLENVALDRGSRFPKFLARNSFKNLTKIKIFIFSQKTLPLAKPYLYAPPMGGGGGGATW